MNAPKSGLRRLFYNAKSVAKVSLSVQPGDVLEVSDDVAAQLVAADPHFEPAAGVDPAAVAALAQNKTDEAARLAALDAPAEEELPPAPADAAETVETPTPRKATAAKKARK